MFIAPLPGADDTKRWAAGSQYTARVIERICGRVMQQ
jgi:hypothetical protein